MNADDASDLDREIEAALGDESVLEIARREIYGGGGTAAAAGGPVEAQAFREGTVAGVTKNDVFLEFGPREQGVVPFEQFATEPTVGSTVRVFVEGQDPEQGLWLCSIRRGVQSAEWASLEEGAIIAGEVKAANKGGVEMQCGVLTAFLPASHISLERIEDLETVVGQRFEVEVIEVDPERKKLVVSRRGLLARQRDQARADAVEQLVPGMRLKGKVTRVEPYGAFVEIGTGLEGLVHVSELSWTRLEHPKEKVAVGDALEVEILEIKEGGKRVGLSVKALETDPWLAWTGAHPSGTQVQGTVTRLASYGAFVKVTEGVEGLAHVSQLAPGGVGSPREVVHVGQTLTLRVAEVDASRRRIGLSLLTERGDRLGDDVADDATIREHLAQQDDGGDPTLGDLLKKALEGK